MSLTRRTLLTTAATVPLMTRADSSRSRISLAQWSLHRTFFGSRFGFSGEGEGRDPLDFPSMARHDFGLDAVEYVNTFYFDKAGDEAYFARLQARAADAGVQSLLIMCDRLGNIGEANEADRRGVVEAHRPWLTTAAQLGCHSIRVNAASTGSPFEQQKLAADGLSQLAVHASELGLNVLVENHGGLSSNGAWLAGVMQLVDLPNVGTLPDFGNFRVSEDEHYDRYLGVTELMPFARALSAKSYDFDDAGDETTIDYRRMLKIAADAGYEGWIGIEYEGRRLSEADGIRATHALLQRLLV